MNDDGLPMMYRCSVCGKRKMWASMFFVDEDKKTGRCRLCEGE